MAKKPTIKAQKEALYEQYHQIYTNYYGDDKRKWLFRTSHSVEQCQAALDVLKQAVQADKTKRQYLARIAGLKVVKSLQNERMAMVTLKHFFTDSQITHFSYEEEDNPHYSRGRPMRIYHLYDVMQVARRKKLVPRLKKINFETIAAEHHDKLRTLYSYFEQYLAFQNQS